MRKLASIQRIKEICPIENAHNIELAKILNWQCVVKKGEFLVGDLVVYIEPDAVLPEDPRYDFLGDKCRIDKNGFKGYLIKVARMRGVFSQGLCLPLSILPGGHMKKAKNVSDILNIVKYDPPLPAQLNGIMLGHIPSFIPKTDEPRIQATRNVLTRNRGKRLYVTEKLDGTSATYYFRDGHFGVCSRNIELKPSNENTYWNVARKLKLGSSS